mmetsp:Transcript_115889/g.201655  ORF Transcript_115889/g.201655 Transcript_115889/m.201655 type:complete len:109 (+) Transcript_115889:993-1319(+)
MRSRQWLCFSGWLCGNSRFAGGLISRQDIHHFVQMEDIRNHIPRGQRKRFEEKLETSPSAQPQVICKPPRELCHRDDLRMVHPEPKLLLLLVRRGIADPDSHRTVSRH